MIWTAAYKGGNASRQDAEAIVADGTDDARQFLERALRHDPGKAMMRHTDAGYQLTSDTVKQNGLDFNERLNMA